MQDGHNHLEHTYDLFFREAQRAHALHSLPLRHCLVNALHVSLPRRVQEGECTHIHVEDLELASFGGVLTAPHDLLEDVVVALAVLQPRHPTLFQQVVHYLGTHHRLLFTPRDVVELNLYELAKTRRIVVPQSLGVSEALQEWIAVEDLPLDGLLLSLGCLAWPAQIVAHCQLAHEVLGQLSLAGSALTRYDDALVRQV